ncbi:transposase [Mycolicibacterium fortuitum]|uniref:RNA-guided endonuclease InsQ/TnpB family protein n=1 Tax=Mycolicibacterium fortuitum TaxID=1766 RepID=UPI0034CDC0B9
MRRSFKFALAPTSRQSAALTAMLVDHCTLYNAALQERRDAYRHPSCTSIQHGQQREQLTAIRDFDADQARWGFSSQQATLKRLDRAFQAFFRRVKNGENPGYPRFRSARRFDTVEFPRNGDGCAWNSAATGRGRREVTTAWTTVYVKGVGHVKVNQHRPVDGVVKTVSITRGGSVRRPKWFVILSCDGVPDNQLPETGHHVGIDLATGINGLAWTSDGEQLLNPRAFRQVERKLAALQREADLLKPKPGQRWSCRYRRLRERIALTHAKAARIRLDNHHKQALALVQRYDLLAVEEIATARMTRRPKPKPDPAQLGVFLPNNAAAKAGLNKSILDTGWSQFLAILTAKAECAGRSMVTVNPAYTSQTCHRCGNVDPAARDGKLYTCTNPACDYSGDADVNAGRNILRAGLVQLHAAQAAA